MPITPNLSTVTVSGTYVDIQGNAIAGQVKFTPRASIKDSAYNQIIVPRTISVTLDGSGSFSVVLPATDDTDTEPINWTYQVEEAFTNGRTFDMSVPAGASINLADVVPAVESTGDEATTYVLISQYNTLEARVDDIETVTDGVAGLITDIESAEASAVQAANDVADIEDQFLNPFLLLGL